MQDQNEYSTGGVEPAESYQNYQDPNYYAQQQMMQQNANNSQITFELMSQIINTQNLIIQNQEKQAKHLKSINTNTSILAAVVIIEIIATLLIFFR